MKQGEQQGNEEAESIYAGATESSPLGGGVKSEYVDLYCTSIYAQKQSSCFPLLFLRLRYHFPCSTHHINAMSIL